MQKSSSKFKLFIDSVKLNKKPLTAEFLKAAFANAQRTALKYSGQIALGISLG
jgi:hypothetical protein